MILHQKRGSIRSVDLAGYMGYSKPSVSHAVKNLRAGGFLTVDETGCLCLTDTGQTIAEKIYGERFLLYALYGYSYAEIGMLCRCSKVSAFESIEAVRKKFLKYFENHPNDWPL